MARGSPDKRQLVRSHVNVWSAGSHPDQAIVRTRGLSVENLPENFLRRWKNGRGSPAGAWWLPSAGPWAWPSVGGRPAS